LVDIKDSISERVKALNADYTSKANFAVHVDVDQSWSGSKEGDISGKRTVKIY